MNRNTCLMLGCVSLLFFCGCSNKNQGIADLKFKEALKQNENRVRTETRKLQVDRYKVIHIARETARLKAEEESARQLKERTEKVAQIEEQVKKYEDRLQSFSVKEAPSVWQTRQYFMAEVETLDEKIESIKETYSQSGGNYEKDESLMQLCKIRNKLVRRIRRLEDKLVDAMLASQKFVANPDNQTYGAEAQKSLMECELFAESEKNQYAEQKAGKEMK
jgi:archaellum component FlaC